MLHTDTPKKAHADVWSLRRVDSLAGMERMREDWRALEARAANPLAYFQSYDWCRNWCLRYAAEADAGGPQIRIFAAYLADRLVALWPLMLVGGRPGIRKLIALTEPHCQYGNILADPVAAPQSLIGELGRRWLQMIGSDEKADAIIFESVPASALPSQLGAGGDMVAATVGLNSSMDLTRFGGFDTYRAGLKSKTRRHRNKRRNKLAALGQLDYRVHFGSTREYRELVSAGIAMKRDWLEQTGRATRALNLPHVPEFLGALSNNAAGDNGAVVGALMLDGRPIAIEIGFLYHRRFYSYLGSFDWAMRDYSPGKIQLEEALKWCFDHNVVVYDLLGAPATYKSDWCNATEELVVYRMAKTALGRAYLNGWCDNLRPFLKRSFERVPLRLRARLIPFIERNSEAARAVAPAN